MSYPVTPPAISLNTDVVGTYPLQACDGEDSTPGSSTKETSSSCRHLPESYSDLPEDWSLRQSKCNNSMAAQLDYECWAPAQNSIDYVGFQSDSLQEYRGRTSMKGIISTDYGTTKKTNMTLFGGLLETEQPSYSAFNTEFWQDFNPGINLIGDWGFLGNNEMDVEQNHSFEGTVLNNIDATLDPNHDFGVAIDNNKQNFIGIGLSPDNSDLNQILYGNSGLASVMCTTPSNRPDVVNSSGGKANTGQSHLSNDNVDPTLISYAATNNDAGEKSYVSPYISTDVPTDSSPVQKDKSPKKRRHTRGSISSNSSAQSPTKKQKQSQPRSPVIGIMPPLVLPTQNQPSSKDAGFAEVEKSKIHVSISPTQAPSTPTKNILTLADAINVPYAIKRDGKVVKMYCPIRDPRWLKEAVIRWATENMRDQINAGIPINGVLRDVDTFDFVNCFNIYASVFDNKPEKRNKLIAGFMQQQYTNPKDFKIINPYLPHTLSSAPDQLIGPVGPIRDGFGELDAYKQRVKQAEDANRAVLKKATEVNTGYAALIKENSELKAQLKALKDMADMIPNFN